MTALTVDETEQSKAGKLASVELTLSSMTAAQIVSFVDGATNAQLKKVITFLLLKEKART